jgi:hypothetical protein
VILAPDSDATGAVRVADACLYEAKLAGRNCVRLRDLRSDVTDLQQVSLLRH